MSTGTFVIESALRRIGAHSIVQPAPEESIVEGMLVLNAMLQGWRSQAIFLEVVPLGQPSDELSEPADATNGIIDNLALMLAPMYEAGKPLVSPQLKANATKGFEDICSAYQKPTIPNKVVSATLPKGAGHKKQFTNNVFFDKGSALSD